MFESTRHLFEILSERIEKYGGSLEFQDDATSTALLPHILTLSRQGKLNFEMTVQGYVVTPGPKY